eukprot:gnl/TRDRNA2_/TRDRNA2_188192_c0_seq1.p1 gnl/TRDRNA2_/TRDRNA2_188192_c0~~gnl/TRDRNA2_/TRDRNA2_188192_c0_seq1.p1  ORF type:complete len:166 (+),score=28.32 gnl/TRDRNA2_/TRDRNA2_188192_c0_seq1:186-683(+)
MASLSRRPTMLLRSIVQVPVRPPMLVTPMVARSATWPHKAGLASPAWHRRSFCSFPVSFVSEDGDTTTVQAKTGQTMLEVAHENDVDIEGACGGECACSTCHVILSQEAFDLFPEADEDEVDMLDLAAGVTDLSRLACQLKMRKDKHENLRINLPAEATNLLAGG